MVIAEGVSALKSIKSLYDIAKEVRDSSDPEKLRAAAAQMFDLALAAREQTAALQDERNDALVAVTGLTEEVARLKAWDAEKRRYQMKVPVVGAVVYTLKPECRDGEPPHWLCANCFTRGTKSFLNVGGSVARDRYWDCPNCETQLRISFGVGPT